MSGKGHWAGQESHEFRKLIRQPEKSRGWKNHLRGPSFGDINSWNRKVSVTYVTVYHTDHVTLQNSTVHKRDSYKYKSLYEDVRGTS